MTGTPVQQVVVAVDGSPSSREALRWAAHQAEVIGARLQVVTAWTYPDVYGWSGLAAVDWSQEARRLQDAAVAEVLDDAQSARVERHVVEGRTVPALLEAAAGADLLVVGSRGHGAFAGMLLGSVSQHLTAHAPCPVVVVPTQADRVGRATPAEEGTVPAPAPA